MIHVLSQLERDSHYYLFEQMFRERHKLYVEGRGWKELGRGDGREIDQFDTSSTIYLVSIGDTGDLQGSIRLNPTTGPYMLNTIFPELCTSGQPAHSVDVWEMSRLFVNHHSEHDENNLLIKGKLFCAMYEFCLLHEITSITAVCDSYFLPRVLKVGVKAKPLGLPRSYESGEMIAVSLQISEQSLVNARAAYKVPAGLLVEQPPVDNGTSIAAISHSDFENTELSSLMEISSKSSQIERYGSRSKRDQFIEEFHDLVIQLGSNDPSVVSAAEKQLDSLEERVRDSLKRTSRAMVEGNGRLQ